MEDGMKEHLEMIGGFMVAGIAIAVFIFIIRWAWNFPFTYGG